MWYIQHKNNEQLIHATTWENLENMLGKRSQAEKQRRQVSMPIKCHYSTCTGAESQLLLPRAASQRERLRVTVKGEGIAFRSYGKGSEIK